MTEFGHFTLLCAWVLSLLGVGFGLYAGRSQSYRWLVVTRNASILVGVSTFFSLLSLGVAFYQSDFTNQYVWQYSNIAMEPIYRITAIWGGMDGSMLLWVGILTLAISVLALHTFEYPRRLIPWVLAIANTSSLFFLTIVVFYTNPFRHLVSTVLPPDGNGLNPLLQNPYMAIHPPMLYAGFTLLAIPYAFCMGALLSGSLSNEWIRLTRRWTLIGWGFLTVGIMLGGHWAYVELGWGGFWAWDPVENASFLPWLTATAFLHSVMIQERKDMLKFWNVWLVTLTYGLTVFGTFITRSGIVQSVHAFASTDIGEVFLQYLSFIFLLALVLVLYRRKELRPARHIESLFSREAAFLLNNLVLLSIMFATLWGVLF
ncbi:MAG: cytochrome c biogenesis protein CcsA, partial [Bdellovibrionales bacterium]|nr:cytochrome c biogenesis protein CcsA [Bdellovibrionales bacterium]